MAMPNSGRPLNNHGSLPEYITWERLALGLLSLMVMGMSTVGAYLGNSIRGLSEATQELRTQIRVFELNDQNLAQRIETNKKQSERDLDREVQQIRHWMDKLSARVSELEKPRGR